MDILAHSLWTNVMYKYIPQTTRDVRTTRIGIVFGVLPDLVSFTPVFVYLFYQWIFQGQGFFAAGTDAFGSNPYFQYAGASYNYTHSLVVWAAATVFIWGIRRKFPLFLLGWALHICIDIFTHTTEFYATPFLYPLWNFKISVISWGNPIFMLVNYLLLFLLYAWFLPKLKKSQQ